MAKLTGFVVMFLLMTAQPMAVNAWLYEVVGGAVGIGVVAVGAPFVLSAAGFGAAGIAAGSFAAKAMSLSYTTGVGAGAIAALQSAGAAGFGTAVIVVGGAFGVGTGHYLGSSTSDNDKK